MPVGNEIRGWSRRRVWQSVYLMAHCSLIMDFCIFYYLTSSYLCSLQIIKEWIIPLACMLLLQLTFLCHNCLPCDWWGGVSCVELKRSCDKYVPLWRSDGINSKIIKKNWVNRGKWKFMCLPQKVLRTTEHAPEWCFIHCVVFEIVCLLRGSLFFVSLVTVRLLLLRSLHAVSTLLQ